MIERYEAQHVFLTFLLLQLWQRMWIFYFSQLPSIALIWCSECLTTPNPGLANAIGLIDFFSVLSLSQRINSSKCEPIKNNPLSRNFQNEILRLAWNYQCCRKSKKIETLLQLNPILCDYPNDRKRIVRWFTEPFALEMWTFFTKA